jgi:hypothetical protein
MNLRLTLIASVALLCGCSSGTRQVAGVESVRAQEHGFSLKRFDDRVEVALDGKPYTTFHFHSKWDKPFLYPIRTASGLVISRGYPIEPRPGEEHDHAWHRGIWYGHGDINGEDFWREIPEKGTARLVLAGEPKTDGSTLDASLAMMTAKGKRMGTIGERYGFRQDGQNVLIDSTITISADGGQSLKFGDSDDGGFGFRLSDDFRQDRGAELTNSEGLKGTENIWGKPARWVKYSATTGGKRAGLAMLDHPKNLRHPTRWHARGYSLCSANPFALAAFTKYKKADGSYTLPAGEKLQFHYLVIVHEGELAPAAVERYFTAFARR